MGKIEKSLILDSYIRRRKCNERTEICEKKKKQEALRRVAKILRKCEALRTSEESRLLESATDVVKLILNRKNRLLQSKERVLEKEDPPDVIEEKARKLAEVISRARHLVCYTGAGISTSARIPDYRGSNGIWTLLQQGKEIGQHDLSLAEPTYTHMALYELHRRNILRSVISQNCDGLHLRSGLPRKSLSEVHGNMYVEVCKSCKPNVEYWRLFDTTELTARYYHKTNRRCHMCGTALVDTIVHFGERGSLKWPLNWDGATHHAGEADVILCLGSSLKVLKKYPWLWSMDRPKSKRPQIYIVNLQWTPKDAIAKMKINGKCDEVMKLVMKYMDCTVSEYDRRKDPIFAHASLLAPEELHTRSQPMLRGHQEPQNDGSEVTDDSNDSKSQILVNGSDDSNGSEIKVKPLANGKLLNENNCTDDTIPDDLNAEKICDKSPSNDPSHTPNSSSMSTVGLMPENAELDCKPKPPPVFDRDNRVNECNSITKSPSPTKFTSRAACLLNNDHKDRYKHLIDYCKVIGHLPHWYDVNYAYSGLHSIIYPPPTEVDLWGSVIIPIFDLNRSDAECDFCFDNYAEHSCQFYRPKTTDFVVTSCRNGRLILCECCDFTDVSDSENTLAYGGGDDDDDEEKKRAKLENVEFGKDDKGSVKIQAGWYGKGYRKMFRRKRRA